ncbi:MAG: DEAD/DEAH box helicase [Saprospiraceae bacterium]|nr:DEAD/DEAH box helicase [Saprospiraceae bacterium]MCF8248645.1 DEAD/DEAH box helicase [Saprospiraceae bacterium]MCF8278865.1 DEAD/DEAH box helicase [Bacteroidales bacterium]MCF8310665.1 DEAD/DEAH box helicase [Saprospiraceae bacterium]MCF8439224.1 DEAD/DEAH box helicase [Saprospiraceae bacterium]
MPKPAATTVVFDLRRYLPGGWYLPGAHIVGTDADGTLNFLLQTASPITIGSYGIELTPLLAQLFDLIDSLSERALEAKFNPPKGKPKPLDELLQNPDIKPLADRYVHRQVDVFLRKMVEHRLPLTFMAAKKVMMKDVLVHYPDAEIIPHLIFRRTKDKIIYRLNFTTGEERWLVRWKQPIVLTNHPGWILVGDVLYPLPGLNGNMLKPFMQRDEQPVPNHMVKEYFQKFILKAAERAEIEAEGFEVTSTRKIEGCDLTLTKHLFKDEWLLAVSFRYLGTHFSQNDPRQMRTALHFDEAGEIRVMQVKRQPEAEQAYLDTLANFDLEQTEGSLWQQRNNESTKQEGDHFYQMIEWLRSNAAALAEAGFTLDLPVFEDKKISLRSAEWTQDVQLVNDWFDLRITVRVGEYEFPFARLINHIRTENRWYELPDGSFFIIPAEWMARFHGLAHLGQLDGDELRLAKSQRPLLEGMGNWEIEKLEIEDQPVFEVPALLKADLRPYQLEGASWLANHYRENLGACLADDMGLGKTLQTLAVLLHAKTVLGIGDSVLETEGTPNELPIPNTQYLIPLKALIVLPSSLVFNWEREVKKFAPGITICKHIGSGRTKDVRILSRFDLVLTTYQTARLDMAFLKKIEWEYVVLDESQYIKNPESAVFKAVGELVAKHKISLSGTPIENSLADLWAQMQFLNPGMLGSFGYFKKHFIKPIEKQEDELKKAELRRLVQPYLLRRTKEEVAPELPPLTELVFYTEMTEPQRKLYEQEKSAVRNQILNLDPAQPQNRIAVLAALMRLRQIANHPALVGSSTVGSGQSGAASTNSTTGLTDSQTDCQLPTVELPTGSGKFNDILEYFDTIRRAGHKVLMFSSFEQYLQLFRAEFEKAGHQYAWLTGRVSQAQRKQAVDKFSTDPKVQAFLITTKAGGVGLNLTAADYVFVLDPWWNPFVEDQAIARAHRIGQTEKVVAVKFIAKDTIEEKILKMQEKKAALAGEILATGDGAAFSRDELVELLG